MDDDADVYQVGLLHFIKPTDPTFSTLGECVSYLREEDQEGDETWGIWGVGPNQGHELVAIMHENRYFKEF